MKIGDLLSVCKNKTNKQITASFKKRKLKELDLDILDVLNMRIKKKNGNSN